MSIHALTSELLAHRHRLQQLAKYNGKAVFQLAGEEVAALIEELQSTNEELHSLNQQLEDLNGKLEKENEALTRHNSDLQHLVDNVDVAVLFLDRDLRVTRFTPAITHI